MDCSTGQGQNGVLIVPPDSRSLGNVLNRICNESFCWAYLGREVKEWRRVERFFEDRGCQVDVTPRFHQAAESLRQPFLAYVFGIAQQVDSLLWWLSSVSYRRNEVSKTFHQSCQLKLGLDLANSGEGQSPLILVVADAPTRRALQRNLMQRGGVRVKAFGPHRSAFLEPAWDRIRMLARRTFFLVREGRRMLLARWLIPHRHLAKESTTLLFNFFGPRNFGQGAEFHKLIFGDLPRKLGDLGFPVTNVPLILREVPYKSALDRLKNGVTPVLVMHRHLTLSDLVWAVLSTLRETPQPRPLHRFCGMDIGPLVEEDLRGHWVSNRAAEALLMVALIRRLSKLTSSVKRIVYVYENQPWERALCWGVKRYMPDTTLVGYQHARVPHMLLNFPLAPGEETVAPLPDRIITVGKHTASILASDGYSPDRLRVGGALPVQGLLVMAKKASQVPESRCGSTVLIACPNMVEEAAELVEVAARLFEPDTGVRIVIKCHPITPFEMLLPSISPLPDHVEVSEEALENLMLKSSVMVYTGSTVCVQALALGLPVVHLRPQFELDQDPLEATPEVRLEATGVEQLREVIRWLLDNRDDYIAEHRNRWDEVVDEMYEPVTEKTFRAFVE